MTIEEFIKLPRVLSTKDLAKVLNISSEEVLAILCKLDSTFATFGNSEILFHKRYVSALITE